MKNILSLFKKDADLLISAIIIVIVICSGLSIQYAKGEGVSLTLNVQSAVSFATSDNDFGNINPERAYMATTTLIVTTNSANGWNVTLIGDDQADGDTVCDLDTNAAIGITDALQWMPNTATT